MKHILTLSFALFSISSQGQQINIGRKVKDASNHRANTKVDNTIDKGLNNLEDGIGGMFKKKKKDNGSNNNDNTDAAASSGNSNSSSSQKSFSATGKFDFVSGEKIIVMEDFSQDAAGDFPAKWNTNGSGDLVMLNGHPNKYISTSKEGVFYPEFISSLPENFTVEFDLASTPKFSFYSGYMVIGFTDIANVGKQWRNFMRFGDKGGAAAKSTVEAGFHPTNAGSTKGMTSLLALGGGQEIMKSENDQNSFSTHSGNTEVHVSIWRQKSRIRVYIDQEKVWDIPRAFADGAAIKSLYFRNDGASGEEDAFYIANLRVAAGAPDLRNKLLTEGKFVTRGILFNSGSAAIQPASAGVLKEIANVMKENPELKVKIVGHTDSDGDDAANMKLSADRAAAIKKALAKDYGVSEGNMTTEGKGESQPADVNTTAAGKANNRRVEFIKS